MNKCYQKSVLDAYNENVVVDTDGYLVFANDYINTGVSISTPSAPYSTINLNKAGLYQVVFTATVSSSATGDISLQLFRNGVAVNGAISTITASSNEQTISIISIIKVDNTCACSGIGSSSIPLVFQNIGVGATYTNAKLNIVRLA